MNNIENQVSYYDPLNILDKENELIEYVKNKFKHYAMDENILNTLSTFKKGKNSEEIIKFIEDNLPKDQSLEVQYIFFQILINPNMSDLELEDLVNDLHSKFENKNVFYEESLLKIESFSSLIHGMKHDELEKVCLSIQESGPLFLKLAQIIKRPLYIHSNETLPRSIQYFEDGQIIIHLKTQKGKGLPVLGQGGESRATKSLHYNLSTIVANASALSDDKNVVAERQVATNVMKNLHGIPGIPRVYGHATYYSKKPLLKERKIKGNILTELYPKGSFVENGKLIATRSRSKEQFIDQSRQLLTTISQMHNKGYVHRDIKPQNIVMKEDGELGLIDFGLCHLIGKKLKNKNGTHDYMPPEYFFKTSLKAHGSGDVWALGIVFYQMFYGKNPDWIAKSGEENCTRDNLTLLCAKNYETGAPYPEPKDKDSLAHIIWEMLDVNPERRISAEEALKKLNYIASPFILSKKPVKEIKHYNNPFKVPFPENDQEFIELNHKLKPGDVILELDRGQLEGFQFSLFRKMRNSTQKKSESLYKPHHAEAYHYYIYAGNKGQQYHAIDAMPDNKHGIRKIDFFRDHSVSNESVFKVFRCRQNVLRNEAFYRARNFSRPKKYLYNEEGMKEFEKLDSKKSNEFSFYEACKSFKNNAFNITSDTKKRAFVMIADNIIFSDYATGEKQGKQFFCSSLVAHVYQAGELLNIWKEMLNDHVELKEENDLIKNKIKECKDDKMKYKIINEWSKKMAEQYGESLEKKLKVMKLDPNFTSPLDMYKFLEESPEFEEVLEIVPKN